LEGEARKETCFKKDREKQTCCRNSFWDSPGQRAETSIKLLKSTQKARKKTRFRRLSVKEREGTLSWDELGKKSGRLGSLFKTSSNYKRVGRSKHAGSVPRTTHVETNGESTGYNLRAHHSGSCTAMASSDRQSLGSHWVTKWWKRSEPEVNHSRSWGGKKPSPRLKNNGSARNTWQQKERRCDKGSVHSRGEQKRLWSGKEKGAAGHRQGQRGARGEGKRRGTREKRRKPPLKGRKKLGTPKAAPEQKKK